MTDQPPAAKRQRIAGAPEASEKKKKESNSFHLIGSMMGALMDYGYEDPIVGSVAENILTLLEEDEELFADMLKQVGKEPFRFRKAWQMLEVLSPENSLFEQTEQNWGLACDAAMDFLAEEKEMATALATEAAKLGANKTHVKRIQALFDALRQEIQNAIAEDIIAM